MISLAVVVVLLPFSGDTHTLAGYISAYVLVLLPAGSLLYGLLVLTADLTVSKLLFFGVATGTVGVVACLCGRPETLVEGPTPALLTLLFYPGSATMYAGNGQLLNSYEMEGVVTHTPMDVVGEPLGIAHPY